MPLVILSGFPSAGLSTRAKELESALKERLGDEIKDVVVVSDDGLGIAKSVYSEKDPEKAARGAQMAAVKRFLSKDTVVILDNLSYIKGFRYQLFCEAKAASTTSVVIQVGTSLDKCKEFNAASATSWPQDLFDALAFRYEEPNAMARWDSPLFILLPEDPLPIEDIWESLVNRKPAPPNQATTVKPAAPSNYVAELNDETSAIVRQAMELHKDAPGAQVMLAGRRVSLPHRLTLAQLNRIRRNFVQLNKSAPLSTERIGPFFVEFLQNNWEL